MAGYASQKQINLVVETSERKNKPEDHYKLVTSAGSMTSSDVSYEIELAQSKKQVNTREVYNINRKISEDPTWWLKEKEKKAEEGQTALYKHKLVRFKNGDMGDKAIVYIELKEDKLFRDFIKMYPWDIEEDIKKYLENVGVTHKLAKIEEPIEAVVKEKTLNNEQVWDLFDFETEEDKKKDFERWEEKRRKELGLPEGAEIKDYKPGNLKPTCDEEGISTTKAEENGSEELKTTQNQG